MCFGLEFNFAVANKACGEAPGFSHFNGFDKPAPLLLMRPPSYVIALGIESRGEGERERVPSSSKVWRGLAQKSRNFFFFQNCKNCFEGHIMHLCSCSEEREQIHLYRWFLAYHTDPPPPRMKIVWRRPWPLPSLFRTYLAQQNCNME